MTVKRRRKSRKKWKLSLNHFANSWRMSLETKLRRLLFPTELMSLLASWWLENMGGVPTWRESWKLRLWETPPWLLTWCPRRLWRSTQRMLLSRSWGRRLKWIRVTRLWRTWSGCCLRPLSWLQDSLWMSQTPSPAESTEWSNWDSPSLKMKAKMMKNSLLFRNLTKKELLQTRWKMLIENISYDP